MEKSLLEAGSGRRRLFHTTEGGAKSQEEGKVDCLARSSKNAPKVLGFFERLPPSEGATCHPDHHLLPSSYLSFPSPSLYREEKCPKKT
jgi:hypothetical protein